MIYPTEKDLAILKSRSLFSKKVVDNFKQNKFEILKSIISEHLKTLQDDDDPYYKGFLYSILIRVFILENNAFEVVYYVNEILKFSGMVLYEYCGRYSPFEKNTLKKVLVCYDELIKNELTDANLEHASNSFSLYKNYMSLLGKFRYDRRNYLEEIILGPKVEQKDSVAEYFINHIKKLGLDVAVSQSKAPLA